MHTPASRFCTVHDMSLKDGCDGAELPRAPSALASSNCADDSWFAVYESRQPIQHPPVADAPHYKQYCEEYSAKYDVYHKLHQEMSTVTR